MQRVRSSLTALTMVIMLSLLCASQARADQSIILRSGNGMVGSQDAQVRFLAYGRGGDITPAASDFESARTGTHAYIDQPYPTYIQSLPTDPLADWISTTPNLGAGSALYAIPFTVTDSVIGSASLNLGYAVDNAINGVYINGTLISGNSHDGDYHGEYYELRSDIANLLKPNAINWLYINASDYGGFAGIIFNATIVTQGGSAAAPSISPNQGGNTGQVTVRIVGGGFQPAQPDATGSQIKLTGIGPEIDATNASVLSPNIITGTFDLTGATPGVRTVTVTNPDKTTLVLSNAFTVLSGGCSGTTLHTMGTPAVKGRTEIFFLTYQNNCTVDSGPITIVEPLEPWSIYNPPPGDSPAVPAPTQTDPFDVPNLPNPYPGQNQWNLPSLPPGGSGTIQIPVIEDPSYPPGQPVQAIGCTATQLANLANTCEQQLETGLKFVEACKNIAETTGFGDEACDLAIAEDYLEYGVCMAGGHAVCDYFPSLVRGSLDPNDLTGPAGYGSQGWFQPPVPLQYALSFNNMPTATNPATNVYVTESFDASKVDIASLAVSGITIPGGGYSPTNVPLATQPFTHDIDLRPTQNLLVRVSAALDLVTNKVSVSYLSLDPAAGQEPLDATIGFLAPGAGGTVLFSVNPKPGLTTGTAIQSSGSVVFDSNAAINTNVWLNTVDITAPASHVVALPPTEFTSSFNVSWTGSDVGSGIVNYSIYVSDNGGPFQYWLLNTMATSGTFTGTIGHTYSFYSIAEDGAGNKETAKTLPDTKAEILAPPPVAAPAFSPAGGTYTTAQSVKLTDASVGAVILYTLNGTMPTANSTIYSTPIAVSKTTTITAIAMLNGVSSTVTSALYTINSGQCQTVDYSKGFTSAGLSLNGGATVTAEALQLTDGGRFEARSAFYSSLLPVADFTTDFTVRLLNPVADGMTFVIQSNNPKVVGQGGGGLGYAGIPKSVAFKLDLHNNYGEGTDSTGMYANGAYPATPALDLSPARINLHSGHVFAVHLTYANAVTIGKITDTVTGASASGEFPGDLSKIVGSNAYVGFTGGTGNTAANQNILTWSFSGGVGCPAN